MTQPSSRVAIIGIGLMGGSLGLALRRKRFHVVGIGRNVSRLRRAKLKGCIDDYTTDIKSGVKGCSTVVLAVPVDQIVPLAKIIRPCLTKDCLVMDVGSVKGPIIRGLENIFNGRQGPFFVGIHPMTGSEKTGANNSRADLYQGATCVVTMVPRLPVKVLRRAERFWRTVGGNVVRLSPLKHDQWVSLVSHLPHLLANAMVLILRKVRGAESLAAGSFRDLTRVAAADPEQWSAIFRMNAGNLRPAIRLLNSVLSHLEKKDFPLDELRRAKKWRDDQWGKERA